MYKYPIITQPAVATGAEGSADDNGPHSDTEAPDTDAHSASDDDAADAHTNMLPDGKSASLARAVGKILATAAARGSGDVVLAVRNVLTMMCTTLSIILS